MVNSIASVLKRPIVQTSLWFVAALLIIAATWGISKTQIPPPQPIQFPHNRHVALEIPCLYCHPGALRGPSPGSPTETKCFGCHQQIDKRTPQIEKLLAYVQNNQPIQWVPVAILPDFVYYAHRPHIAAGLNCENCHGEISQMTVAVPQKMNMGWCLDCHRTRYQNDPVMLTKLTDCVTCHK
jgi:Cytochrome c7 and related cytochrome c